MKVHPIFSGVLLLALAACAEPNFALKDDAPETPPAPEANGEAPSQILKSSTPAPSVAHSSPRTTLTPMSKSAAGEIFDTKEIKFRADENLWKKVSNTDEVATFEARTAKQGVVAFRGETTIPTSLKRIAAVLNDPNIRKEWVDALLETRTVEAKNTFERIEYNHTQVPWPFQDRDFLYRVKIKVNPNPAAMLITMASTEDAREPARSGIVRGEILHSYYYMKEIQSTPPSTQVVIEMAADPKGVIPLWIVNLTQKRWPHHTLLALKKMALRPDLVVPKEIEDYFRSHQPGGRK